MNTILMYIKQKPPLFQHGRLSTLSAALPEATLWSYMIQIASAIKVVHEAGLAVSMVDATKIMVTGKNRCAVSPRVRFILYLCIEFALAVRYCGRPDVRSPSGHCDRPARGPHNVWPSGLHKVGLSHYRYSLHLIISQNITQVIVMIGANRLLHELDDMHR
jgi:PAB-dependent poly(A)-specific ribonuclease subunit 3